ncbi:MAG: tyrosine-type recombinase/integrase [Candidatus Methylomirabilales bacterium]
MPQWVFCSEVGTPLIPWKVERAFKRVLKAAGLPLHFTLHSLRHTYSSRLLQLGESPVYVQRQLGHYSNQTHRGHLREVAPDGQQGSSGSVG